MRLFSWITGTTKARTDVAVRSAEEVRRAILAVNRATAPFQIREGGPGEPELLAEWRIVDERWYEIFAKAGLSKAGKILMKLDPTAREVRSTDQEWSVEWRAGVPTLGLAASGFRGQQKSVEFGAAYGFTEQLELGQIYRYRFSTSEMKTPLRQAVLDCGWGWRGVSFGKL